MGKNKLTKVKQKTLPVKISLTSSNMMDIDDLMKIDVIKKNQISLGNK